MRSVLVLAGLLPCLTAACEPLLFAPDARLAGPAQASVVAAAPDAPAALRGQRVWRLIVANQGGAEHFPSAVQEFLPKGPDLRSFSALSYWVRVTSDNSAVPAKDVSLVLYNRGSDKQQFTRHHVPVGVWTLLRDDISAYARGDIARAQLCLYETQPDHKDTYTWEITPATPQNLTKLDAGWLAPAPVSPSTGLQQARTHDGLILYARSGAASVSLDGAALRARPDLPSGMLVRDVASDSLWVSPADAATLGLKLDCQLHSERDFVRLTGTVTDLTASDRAVSVAFALPVPKQDLTWWEDARSHYPAADRPECANLRWDGAGARGQHSFYPLAAVTRPGQASAVGALGRAGLPSPPSGEGPGVRSPFALSLATPLDEPTISRLIYDSAAERLLVVFDFGLSADCKRFPSQAPFSFVLRRCDPTWGFRDATEQYVRMYPQFFTRRPMREGIWMPFTDVATVQAPEDFGFMFQEGAPNVTYDDAHGYYSFRYTEPMTWWMSMAKELPRTYDAAMGELARWQKAEADDFNRKSARAIPFCGIKEADGRYNHRFENAAWCDGAVFALSPDPDLPTDSPATPNKGHMNYSADYADKTYGPAPQDHRASPGPGQDGEYLDSLEGRGTAQNYRHDHFATSDTPLTFSQQTNQPIVLNWFSVAKFTRGVGNDLHSRGRLLMANTVYASHGWFAPYLDVGGIEVAWLDQQKRYRPDADSTLAGYRWFSHQRPYLMLNNVDFRAFDEDMEQSYFKRCLAYGLYPSNFEGDSWDAAQGKWIGLRYWERPELYNRDRSLYLRFIPIIRQVATAGWEPLTHATCADDTIALERFGNYPDSLHFTVFNNSEGFKTAEVRVNMASLLPAAMLAEGAHPALTALDLVSNLDLAARWDHDALVLTVPLSARNVAAIQIGSPQRIAADLVAHAAEALERHQAKASGEPGAPVASATTIAAALRQAAREAVTPGVKPAEWADRLPALIETVKTLRTTSTGPDTSSLATGPSATSRLGRDVSLASQLCTRAIMIAKGIRLFATLTGSGAAATDMTVRASLVNGSGAPLTATLGFGNESSPASFGELQAVAAGATLPAQLYMDVPAHLEIGQWLNRRLVCRLTLAGVSYTTAAHLDLSPGRCLRTSVTALPADPAARERRFTVTVQNLSPGLLRGLASLVVPPGWELRPPSLMLEIPEGQTRAVSLTAIIPEKAEAMAYPVQGYLAADRGTPDDRKSAPINAFYFPLLQTPGVNVALAARGATVAVDSCYEGYSARPLNDGTTLPAPTSTWTEAAWASQDDGKEHWIEITLPKPESPSRFLVVWAYDNGNVYASQKCVLQAEVAGKWQDLATFSPKPSTAYSVVEFEPTTATKFRLLQLAGKGPESRPGIMWVTEVGLYNE